MALCLLMVVINFNPIFSCSAETCIETQWRVTGKSRVEISGTTNINQFHCFSVNYEGEDTMMENYPQGAENPSFNGEIFVKAAGFDCHNSMMTRDFAKTLKANEFPEISIRFIELKESSSHKNGLFGKVEITLAGKLNVYTVSCIVKEEGENHKHLEGSRTFLFSDFGLQSPQKLLGTIKVRDEVSVDFHLKLKKCNT
ncbi:YceI family protein [Cyclobacterium marinum]|uniref:YceI family protein n=1 Tax=Cyclobacterium marinum TaxID=104 RepID=UPI0011EC5C3A|nr:YceI family protein [Cyclobacterium marinum]MBI0398134.1 YceI family protein [Cyclobacterium marinum]